MALSYKYVLPGGGYAENSIVKEMFDDVKAYVDTFVPSGGAAPLDAQYVTLATNATLTNERVLTGTSSQITLTDNGAGSTVVLALPQDIAITSSPQFASIIYRAGSASKITIKPQDPTPFADYTLTLPDSNGGTNEVMKSDGNGVLSWTSIVSDIHGTTQQVTVSATTGSVTLSLPQDIGITSAPQFSQMLLSGGTSAADLTLKLHDSNNGIYVDGATVFEVIVNSTIAAQWDFTTFQFWNTGPIQAGSFKFRDTAGSHPTVTITPPSGFTSYSLVLPSDDGAANQYLTTDGSGNLSWTNAAGTGTVNTGTANRLAYYAASTAVVSALSALTASRALVSDSNGLPTHATTTATEIGYVNGVTSALQTQLDGKANLALSNLSSVAVNTSLLPGSDNAIDAGSSSKTLRSVYLKTSLIIQQTGAGTSAVTLTAPSSVTSHTLTLPSAQGASSTLLQNDGSGNLSWVTVTTAGGATNALDNLASVAINTSLLPTSDNSLDLGSATKDWRSLYLSTSIKNGSTTLATATELGYLTGVTSAIQTQITAKATDTLVVHLAGTETITGVKTVTVDFKIQGAASTPFNFSGSTGAHDILTIKSGSTSLMTIQDDGKIGVGDGAVGAPGLTFINDTDTGIYRPASNNMRFGAAGTAILEIDSTGAYTRSTSHFFEDGAVGTPAITFRLDTDCGLYRIGTNNFALAAAGAKIWETSAAGEITQPLQSSFLAGGAGGTVTDVTGDATDYTVVFGSEIYDQNSDYASNTFTAPVTGRYLLNTSVAFSGVLVTHTTRELRIVTSNREYRNAYIEALAESFNTLTINVIADMDAGDTATVHLVVSGSTKVVDYEADPKYSFFSGSLIN